MKIFFSFLSSSFLKNKNLINMCSVILLTLTFFLFFQNFFNESGYWYDEWCTLLTSDPNSSLDIIYERHKGNSDKPLENVPILYYLTLRFFFEVFGFTSQNGRIFSSIFYVVSSISIYFLAKKNLNSSQSLFVASAFLSTPLILWMANETRVDMFLIFFSMLNLLIFFSIIKEFNLRNTFFLLTSNIITLSIYPLTISLIASQILFAIFKKNLNLFLLIIFSLIVYFYFNYEYLIDKSLNSGDHFATLHLNFFIGYFFNTFFGSIFFGFIYLLTFVFFLFKNFLKIYKNDLLFFIVLSIIITYLMVIISSLFVTPIAAPRYIIFIIPLILIFIYTNLFIYEKKVYLFPIFFILLISNVYINYDERHIKKPKIDETLLILKKFNKKNIYFEPQDKLFLNYISTVKNIKNFHIINNTDIPNLKLKNFAVICLNNPKFAFKVRPKENNKKCLKNYEGYKEVKTINFDDFLIRFFNKYD